MRNLLIISNRLPFKIEKKSSGLELRETDGGLVTAIKSLLNKNVFNEIGKVRWIGSANFNKQDWAARADFFLNRKLEMHPLFLDKKTEREFYHGFSNSVIWPLFHYFPSFVEFTEKWYNSYEAINKIYAQSIAAIASPEDIIWIHDYHFMLLPQFLRDLGVTNKIGFFLHVPFPSYELFRLLPERWRKNILHNLLAADLVGFQTKDYADHFKECVAKTLETSIAEDQLENSVKAYPISIDFDRFNEGYHNKSVRNARTALCSTNKLRKMIFSVDRLDYTKGVMNRLEAFEELLEENPRYCGKINFVLNVVPSRDEISRYKERKKMIEESIGRINGKFGSINWQPIIYQYRHLTFNQLMAFYTSCDVALVTPLRDGMNLVAKEFVASRKDERGVLVLSDMAGAACALKGAIMVTPTDIRKMKECLIESLEMPLEEQAQRMRAMRSEIRTNNVDKWAADYLSDLQCTKTHTKYDTKVLVA